MPPSMALLSLNLPFFQYLENERVSLASKELITNAFQDILSGKTSR
jgi:hypothetical protein